MSDKSKFEVAYISTDELDGLGYPNKIQVRKVGNDMEHRDYRPDDFAFLQQTYGGQIRCSCCGRQLPRKFISGHGDGWNFCIRCGARIVGKEWE